MSMDFSPSVSASSAPPPDGLGAPRRSRMVHKAVTFAVLSAVGLYVGSQQPWVQGAPVTPVVAAPPPADVAVAAPTPALGDADAAAREALALASPEAAWRAWLSVPGVLSRGVAAVARVADGESPRALLGFLAPAGGFTVVEREGHTYVSDAAFARYDAVTRVVASVDAEALVRGYRVLSPFVEAAYREVAPPGRRFEATLTRALTRLAFAPVPASEVRVVPAGAGWAFAQRQLEARSAAEKHLMRFGPENQRVVQAKLREVQAALAAPTSLLQSARE